MGRNKFARVGASPDLPSTMLIASFFPNIKIL
jgi:hypothetical protein